MADYYNKGPLDGFALKILAVVTMLIDHTGLIFFPDYVFLRYIGRISFPIFAFLIAEGCYHTSNIGKYFKRMLLFACITEIPFDLAFYGRIYIGHQNVLFTFALAIAAVWILRKYGQIAGFAAIIATALGADLLQTDYGAFGVMLVMIFVFTMQELRIRILAGTAFSVGMTLSYQRLCALAMIPIALYNGQRGRNMKYLFYVIYPGHLFVFWLIELLLKQVL